VVDEGVAECSASPKVARGDHLPPAALRPPSSAGVLSGDLYLIGEAEATRSAIY
jgi:hypothetical protein